MKHLQHHTKRPPNGHGAPLPARRLRASVAALFPNASMRETLWREPMLRAAEQYTAQGWPIIPLHGKKPALKHWQDFFASAVARQLWFGQRACNIGLRTGHSGYIVVDTDTDEAEAWAEAHLPNTPMRVRSGGGSVHRYYQTPPNGEVRNRQGWQGIHGLDVRGEGGFIVVPPSRHPETGQLYEWLTPLLPAQALPVFQYEWIEQQTRSRVYHGLAHLGHEAGERRALAWLAQVEGAISGHGGHNRTFRVACKLVQYFGLDRDRALRLIAGWNEKCVPPWSEAELAHKIDDALKLRP